jgi:hypothetical protein
LIEALRISRDHYESTHGCKTDSYEQGFRDGMEHAEEFVREALRHHSPVAQGAGVDDLAQAVKDAERNGANRAMRTLAIALEKFAPHLGLELTKLWNVALSEQERALHEFLSAILTKEEYETFKSAPPKPTAREGGGL